MEKNTSPFAGVPFTSTYTRKQAIADGILVDVSTPYPDDTRVYRFPLAVTREIWDLIKHNAGPLLWDLCWNATRYVVARPDECTAIFLGSLPIAPGKYATKSHRIKVKVGPGDNGEPVVTMMFANQD